MKTKIKRPKGLTRRAVRRPKRLKIREHVTTATVELSPALLKIRRILVPIDFSAPSKKALAYAVAFAQQFGAKLMLLHVVEPVGTPDFEESFPLNVDKDRVMAVGQEQLEHVFKEQAIDPKLVGQVLVRYGRSFNEIAKAAGTLQVDLIIISTHGYTGLKLAFLGSTTERVVRHAPCPVLVVRERQHEFVQDKS